jgi:hypothetical protein
MNPSAPIFDFRFAILDYTKTKTWNLLGKILFHACGSPIQNRLSLRLIRLWRKSTKIQN